MSVSRFLMVSLFLVGLIGSAVVMTCQWLWPEAGLQAPIVGAVSAATVSTIGWLLVLCGVKASPQMGIRAFGVASVLKLMGTGVVALVAKLGPWGGMGFVLIPYIIVFCLCGGLQLVMVVRRSTAATRS